MNKVVINSCYGGFNLSEKARQFLNEKYGIDEYGWLDLPRHDVRLIDCVETLGEEANGHFSALEVVEIKGNQYRIREYDGRESVETPNSTKWVII